MKERLQVSITESLVLDHCWICLTKDSKMNEHHIIPRNSGGTDGPTVTLCTSHHSGVHDAALACYPDSGSNKILKWTLNLPNIHCIQERFVYLVGVIIESRKLTTRDKNKRRTISATLSSADAYRFDQLARALSEGKRPLTQEEVITAAIHHLYVAIGLSN